MRCKSVSYYKGANYCEIIYKNNASAPERYKEDKGWIYSEREGWDMKITGSCSKAGCKINEKCIPKSLGNYECILSDCGMPPIVRGADSGSLERWDAIGIYRQIHLQCHKYIFKKKGSGMLGCSLNGQWTINLTCEFQEVWVPFKGKLYMVRSKKLKWTDAKVACENEGASLVEIKSKEENTWITENLLKPFFEGTDITEWTATVFWIGGKCNSGKAEECTWEKNREKFQNREKFRYHNFRDKEPKDDSEECVFTSTANDGEWNDFYCDQERPYLCEKST
ncbi:C-type mannose receptor 2-like [Saccostrea cucullata]|uniref:C-type mannose receptor 2-like n=1 Tax=Saccostrea cuccullata TaxID=36930 RepID=UPI002ED22EEB